jgi:formylglycine-generating enzyme required for sulfatase activity
VLLPRITSSKKLQIPGNLRGVLFKYKSRVLNIQINHANMSSAITQNLPSSMSSPRKRSGAVLLLLTAWVIMPKLWVPSALGQTANGVFLPTATPYGQTYAAWSARWWQWNFSLPTTNHPIQDSAPIQTGQSGQVWFLGGTFGHGGNQTLMRSGSVPEGTALFIAIMESWADNANCPVPDNFTQAQLRSLAADFQNQVVGMSCTIDGNFTVDLSDSISTPYRVQSPAFNYNMPAVHNYADDLFGAVCYRNSSGTPYTVTGAVADGVYLMVAPLSPGAHTIHFSGSVAGVTQDVTYNLSVGSTPPVRLNLQLYAGNAGLTITGAVGTAYSVEYLSDLDQANNAGAWRFLNLLQPPTSPYLWIDGATPATGQRFYRAAAFVPLPNLSWIPPGTFTMGSPSNEVERAVSEGPQTVVTLTRGFFMGKYEVTQGEYETLMGNNPSVFLNGVPGLLGGTGDAVTNASRHPVEYVNWLDATNYCVRLTDRERRAGRLPPGWVYRLPTEAEWEYACRAGTTGAFPYGAALRSGMANFRGTQEYDSSVGTINNPGGIYLGRTTIVGSYEPNGWGLYDMLGNVWEWCSDWVDFSGLPGGNVIDPQGPATGSLRAIRGGGWYYNAKYCRSAERSSGPNPGEGGGHVGFRMVLAPTLQ